MTTNHLAQTKRLFGVKGLNRKQHRLLARKLHSIEKSLKKAGRYRLVSNRRGTNFNRNYKIANFWEGRLARLKGNVNIGEETGIVLSEKEAVQLQQVNIHETSSGDWIIVSSSRDAPSDLASVSSSSWVILPWNGISDAESSSEGECIMDDGCSLLLTQELNRLGLLHDILRSHGVSSEWISWAIDSASKRLYTNTEHLKVSTIDPDISLEKVGLWLGQMEGLPMDDPANSRSPISSLPSEIISYIFDWYIRLDGPVRTLTQVNRLWRHLAIALQSLWGKILLSSDEIPPSLRGGSVHACGDEDAARQILLRSGVAKLEVTLVMGPQTERSPPPATRASLFKTVDAQALSRITFLCVIINPQMTLPLVTGSIEEVFQGTLPNLEALMIASAYAIGSLFEPFKPLLAVIDSTSLNLRSVYLENANRDFIIKASSYQWWTRLVRLTIRNETDPIDASIFGFCTRLEFLSFSGELTYGAENYQKPIELLCLQWFRIGVVSMGTLAKLRLPKVHSMVIHTVQGNCPNPVPAHHALKVPELKIFHVATVNASVACIAAPKLETLCLDIPTINSSDAAAIFSAIFDGDENMLKPKRLTLIAPVEDIHLIQALNVLLNLESLQLDRQVLYGEEFFEAMTPSELGREKGILCPNLKCLVLDLVKPGTELNDEGEEIESESTEEKDPAKAEEIQERTRKSIQRMIDSRAKHGVALLRLACRWTADGQTEELILRTVHTEEWFEKVY